MKQSGDTALVEQMGGWWLGWVRRLPGVNARARANQELLVALKKSLPEALQFNWG
jgi:hypothetical protein